MIYPGRALVLLPLAFAAVNLTVYFPTLLYMCAGFFVVEYIPSPKSHFHEFGDPVLLSVNAPSKTLFLKYDLPKKQKQELSKRLQQYI